MHALGGRRVAGLVLSLGLCLPAGLTGQTITVLYVGDTHSRLDSFGPKDSLLDGTLGGLTRAAAVIREAQSAAPNTLLLHAGDLFGGDLFFNKVHGVPELQLLRDLGLEAMAVGNHELDFGPSVLARSAVDASLPAGFLLSANLDTSGCQSRADCAPLILLVRPFRIVERGGVKLGIFGMTTPDDPTMKPGLLKVGGTGNPATVVATALKTAADLRAAGAQVVILLSQLGLGPDKAIATGQKAESRIDFILGGHGREALAAPIELGGARIVSAGESYRNVGQLRFTIDGSNVRFDGHQLLTVGPSVLPDPATQASVDSLKQAIVLALGDVFREVLGDAPADIERSYDPAASPRDTPLGNLVTDAYRFKTRTDIGLTTTGFIAERIWKGPIVPADVFRTVPYGYDAATGLDAPLVRIELKGSELLKGIETTLDRLAEGETFLLQFSGLRYQYDSRRPSGQRIVAGSAQVAGDPIDPDGVYSVTTNQAVANLAQQVLRLRFESREPTDVSEYVAVRDYVQLLGQVTARSEGRILDLGRNERNVTPTHRAPGATRKVQRRAVVKRPVTSAHRPIPGQSP